MRHTQKPVHQCYTCLLNMGDYCWLYKYPRGQWRARVCPAFENEAIYKEFRQWQKLPTVKGRKELRKSFFRTSRRTQLYKGSSNFEVGGSRQPRKGKKSR